MPSEPTPPEKPIIAMSQGGKAVEPRRELGPERGQRIPTGDGETQSRVLFDHDVEKLVLVGVGGGRGGGQGGGVVRGAIGGHGGGVARGRVRMSGRGWEGLALLGGGRSVGDGSTAGAPTHHRRQAGDGNRRRRPERTEAKNEEVNPGKMGEPESERIPSATGPTGGRCGIPHFHGNMPHLDGREPGVEAPSRGKPVA